MFPKTVGSAGQQNKSDRGTGPFSRVLVSRLRTRFFIVLVVILNLPACSVVPTGRDEGGFQDPDKNKRSFFWIPNPVRNDKQNKPFAMPKTKTQKQDEVKAIEEALEASPASVFASFIGVTVPEMESFRQQARERGISLRVIKNTLAEKAAKNLGIENLSLKKSGKTLLLASGGEDEATVPQVIHNLSKKIPGKLEIFSGIINKKVAPLSILKQLAVLPSQEELRAELVRSLSAPVSGFVNSLAGVIRNFVSVIKSISEAR